MEMSGMKSANSLRAVRAVFFVLFFLLTCAFDAYSIDPTNKLDFDGDGKADIAVYREGLQNDRSVQTYTASAWYYLGSTSGFGTISWGRTLDIPIPADYVGDSKTDAAIFRWFEPNTNPYDGNWIWINGGAIRGFGNQYGRKMGRNFDSTDNGMKAELGEFRHININYEADPNNPFYAYVYYWQVGSSSLDYVVTNIPSTSSADNYKQVPVAEDYRNGDGKSEIAVYNTTTGCYHVWVNKVLLDPGPACFGSGYKPAPGDYDRDGWVDYGVVRHVSGSTFEWKYISSQSGGSAVTFPNFTAGWSGDGTPVMADYDGDGQTDYAIAQQNSGAWKWTIRKSGCASTPCAPSIVYESFGLSSDVLLASPYFNDPWY